MSDKLNGSKAIVGFDLGHGETSLAWVRTDEDATPKVIEHGGVRSWPTVYSIDAKTSFEMIGEGAILEGGDRKCDVHISFKARPDKNPESGRRLGEYAKVVWDVLRPQLEQIPSPYEIVLGCPSGWPDTAITRYGEIVEKSIVDIMSTQAESLASAYSTKSVTPSAMTSEKPVLRGVLASPRITTRPLKHPARSKTSPAETVTDTATSNRPAISDSSDTRTAPVDAVSNKRPEPVYDGTVLAVLRESRAALIECLESSGSSTHGSITSRDKLLDATLIVDAGSSTLDFTFVQDSTDTPIDAGDDLGAGLIDQMLMQRCLEASENAVHHAAILQAMSHRTQYATILLECRKVKESYFKNEAQRGCKGTGEASGGCRVVTATGTCKFYLNVDAEVMNGILNAPMKELSGRSWRVALHQCLSKLSAELYWREMVPRVVVLVGGASRMSFFQEQLRKAFPEAKQVVGNEPELFVAKGLARWGRRRREMNIVRECGLVIARELLPVMVDEHFPEFVDRIATGLSSEVSIHVVMPEFLKWRTSEHRSLRDTSSQITSKCADWLESDDAQKMRLEILEELLARVDEDGFEELQHVCTQNNVDDSIITAAKAFARGKLEDDGDKYGRVTFSSNSEIAEQINEVFGDIGGMISVTLVALLAPIGPIGWILAVIAWAYGHRIGVVAAFDANIPTWIRSWVLSDAKIANMTKEIQAKLSAGIHESIQKDEALQKRIKEIVIKQGVKRIELVVEKSLLLMR